MPDTQTSRIDGLTTSVAVKAPVRAVATGQVTFVGSAPSGYQTIDGVALTDNVGVTGSPPPDRVLLVGQSDQTQNGIWQVSSLAWSRALDFDGARDAVKGTFVFVNEGTQYANSTWKLTSANPVVFGTSTITFALVFIPITGVVGGSVYWFASTAQMLSGIPGGTVLVDGQIVRTAARTTQGDGGGAEFYYAASDHATADNGGTIRVDGAGRRWFALVDHVTPELFGAAGGTTNDTTALQAALATTLPLVMTKAKYTAAGLSIGGAPVVTSTAPGGTTLALVNGSSSNILALASCTGGKVSNITFDQTGAAGSSIGLSLTSCTNVVIQNIGQIAPNNVGVLLSACVRCTLDGLSSTGGGTSGAWVAQCLNGNNNIVNNVSSVGAVNRTLVIEGEYATRVTKISAVNGGAETLVIDDCYNCVGGDMAYTDNNASSGDDSFAIIGNSYNNVLSGITSYKPAGFGVTIASQASGAPHDNIISNVTVWYPGQQHGSINDGGQATGPYRNRITGLVGINANQQVAGTFPGFDMQGANNNVVEGQIYCDDGKMTYAFVESDNVAASSNNVFRGVAAVGASGAIHMAAASITSRVQLDKNSGVSYPASSSVTNYADILQQTQIFASAFAGDVTITLSQTRAWNGAKVRYVNSASGGHNLIIKQGVTTLSTIAINNFVDVQFDGVNWNALATGAT